MKKTLWRELIVTDDQGDEYGVLGGVVDDAPANLDNAIIINGKIEEWPGFFLSITGEEPDWDTPRGNVDWTGFEAAIRRHRG